MALNFPNNPSLNETHSQNSKIWRWNGVSWIAITLTTGEPLSKTVTIIEPTSSEDISLFYTTNAITITKVRAVLTGSSPSITYSIKSGTDRASISETHVNGATVTSINSGTDATLADTSVAASSWVWLTTSASSGTINSFAVTIEYLNT